MKNIRATMATIVIICSAASSNEADAESLCSSNEHQYFSCSIKDSNKIVSICGNVDLEKNGFASSETGEGAYIQYRFGTKNNIDLIFPKEKKNSIEKFYGQNIHSQFVGIENIIFRIGQYKYAVESSSSSLDEPGYSFEGVLVYKAGQKLPKKYPCESDPFFDSMRNRNTGLDFSKIADELEITNGNGE